MSELINTQSGMKTARWRMLASASVAALLASTATAAYADDPADRPTVWIELGGQLERISGAEEPFAPHFLSPLPDFIKDSPLNIERAARYGYGAEAKVLFAPEGSDWVFSAALRYGRSNTKRRVHEQLPIFESTAPSGYHFQKYAVRFSDTRVLNSENHAVLDFQAGKDVGLGMLGRGATSTFSFGVRYAQFNSISHSQLKDAPDVGAPTSLYQFLSSIYQTPHHHSYIATSDISRSFRGVGPEISWNASVPVAGNGDSAQIMFDWGLNAAVLFGRQKMKSEHQTSSQYYRFILGRGAYSTNIGNHSDARARSRSRVVPNVGGFAGLSFRYADAKVSFGYRADLFFGAMDSGIETRKSGDRDFYGPFATISVGLGG